MGGVYPAEAKKKRLGQEAGGGLENLLTNRRIGTGIANGDVNFFNEATVGKLGKNTAQSLLVGKVIAAHEAINLNVEGDEDAPNLVEEILPAGLKQKGNFESDERNLRGLTVNEEVAGVVK